MLLRLNLKQKNEKIFISISVIILIAVSLWLYETKHSVWSGREEVFALTFSPKWVNQAQFAGVFVAKDSGIYSDAKLQVEIKPFKVGNSVLEDLKSG